MAIIGNIPYFQTNPDQPRGASEEVIDLKTRRSLSALVFFGCAHLRVRSECGLEDLEYS